MTISDFAEGSLRTEIADLRSERDDLRRRLMELESSHRRAIDARIDSLREKLRVAMMLASAADAVLSESKSSRPMLRHSLTAFREACRRA